MAQIQYSGVNNAGLCSIDTVGNVAISISTSIDLTGFGFAAVYPVD